MENEGKIRSKLAQVDFHNREISLLLKGIETLLGKGESTTPCSPVTWGPEEEEISALPEKDGTYVLYTDGSARTQGDRPGGWGWVLISPHGRVFEQGKGGRFQTTNNEMEMEGIHKGLRVVPFGAAVTVLTDSELAIGWLTATMKCNHARIRHTRDMIKLVASENHLTVCYQHIPRCSDEYAKMADNLAHEEMHNLKTT